MSIYWRTPVCVAASIVFVSVGLPLAAQQPPPPDPPQPPRRGLDIPARQITGIGRPVPPPVRPDIFFDFFKKDAVTLKIMARILSSSDEELWQTEYEKITISGHPVPLKLVGDNVAVVVQFIPYLRRGNQWALIAQGQIWFEDGSSGLRYETTLQTIPVKLGEKAYYFPLGPGRADDYIEVSLELNPYIAENARRRGAEEQKNMKENKGVSDEN